MINLKRILTSETIEIITQRPNYITFYWTCDREVYLVRILFDIDAQLSVLKKDTNDMYFIDEKKIKKLSHLCFGEKKDIKQFKGKKAIHLQTISSTVKKTNILKFRC